MTNIALRRATFTAIHAETPPLYSPDWPHSGFDVPARIPALPFLPDRARCNVPGETARTLSRL